MTRLFKAARRTFRAEITLIIVTIIITSWSVYALCKYSFGVSDTVLGLPINPQVTTPAPPTTAPQNGNPALEQQSTQPPSGNESKSSTTSPAFQAINDQAKPANYQTQSFGSSSSLSSESVEPQQVIYSPQEKTFNWNQLLQDLSADRDSDAIRNVDLNSIRPHEQLRSFQAHAQYMKPSSGRFTDDLNDDINALTEAYHSPLRSPDRSTVEPPSMQHQHNHRRRHYRTPESTPEQYSRSKNRRLHDRKTYYAPGRDRSREIPPKHVRDYEEESRSPEASLDDLEDSPAKVEPADDRDQREGDDSGEDRQAAESSRDPSELVVKQAPDDADSNSSASVGSEEGGQPDGLETTTETPSSASGEEAGGDEETGDGSRQDSDGSANESTSEPNGLRGEQSDELDHTDEEALKDTGNAIDEEVDRMTQPSSSVTSQQERPFNYKNTVQFDDSVSSGSDVVSPQMGRKRTLIKKGKGSDEDLRMDSLALPPVLTDPDKLQPAPALAGGSKQASDGPRKPLASKENKSKHRRKRSSGPKLETIRAPYELDEFLDRLNFDSLTGRPVNARPRRSRALANDLNAANSTTSSVTLTGGSIAKEPIMNEDSKRAETRLSNNSSFYPDDGNTDYPSDYEDGSVTDSEPARNVSSRVDKKKKKKKKQPPSGFRYLKSNDTGLQELLKKRELLDVLKQSKLPAPSEPGGRPNRSLSNDHSTADSLFTVDHGLLLYPSPDEEHAHHEKSSSKKKKKHESKKAKKKSMIAIKKGGHKKKKHKKEEKKFHKEKKFKGAKKGKKVSKGKGGQGGKKGKKHYKDKGFKKKGFKNVYHKEEFGQKKSYFDEYRDKDFKKKWKKYDDKYNYAQMKKWQAKDVKKAKKMKDHGMKYKKYDKSRYKKKHQSHEKKHSHSSSKKKKSKGF